MSIGILSRFLFALHFLLMFEADAADQKPQGPVKDTDLRSIEDLLRGYNQEELDAARKNIPKRPEPPLATTQPREVLVKGWVYEDKNGNGKREADEAGLPYIMVSDGDRVTRTAKDGSYEFIIQLLDEPHHRFVCATRSTGFKPTTDFFGRIRFDEKQTRYEFDFGFVKDAKSAAREFWFMAASDSQFTAIEQMIPTAKDYAQLTAAPGGPAFLTTAGDLTMNGTHFEWDMYDHIRRSSRIPVYEGFGGHDGNILDPRCTVNFEQRIGPPYYSWNYGGVHFIQFITETGYLRNAAQIRQKNWLKADLEALPKGMPVIAISHYPLDAAWFNRRKAEGINMIGQIGAHWHVVQAGSRHGVPVLNSAPARGRDWGAYSRTYRWVYVSPKGVTSKLRVAGQYKRLRVMAPGPVATMGSQPLVVLAYDTALLVDSVTCKWTSPAGKVTTTKLQSQGDWSWHGEFAPDQEGAWRCELQARDAAGKLWQREQMIAVQNRKGPAAVPGKDFPWVLEGNKTPRRITEGLAAPLYPLWVKHTGSTHVLFNSPVVAKDRVYVSIGNPNAGTPGTGVLCLDAAKGKQIWRSTSPMGDIRGPVSVHDGIVYAITGEGWVAAYDADNGKLLWSKPLAASYEEGRPLAINNTPPVPTPHGLVVSDWRNPQFLLDYKTGKEKAVYIGDIGHYGSFATFFDDILYSVRRGGGVAFSMPGGKEVWRIEETSRSTSAPIVVDGKLIYSGSSGIRVREAATGKMIWQAGHLNAGYQNAIPVVWDELLLVNGTDCRAFNLKDGKPLWTVKCATDAKRFHRSRRQAMAGSSTPFIAGDLAWFGHDDTSLRAVNKAGKVVWEYVLGTPIKTSPVITGNLLFVHDFAGNLWCFAGANLN